MDKQRPNLLMDKPAFARMFHLYVESGRFRCRDCGRFISYWNITKEFDGCYHCSGEQD